MHANRRQTLAMLTGLGVGHAWAQAGYPNKPVRVVIGFPAGTTGDVVMRILAPLLGDVMGQAVIVENRPGAGSSIAAEAIARARPDGYTLLLSTTANVINPSLYPGLSFDFLRDLTPVTMLGEAPALLVGHPSLNAKSLTELVALAKTRPDSMSFASSGNGTFTHLYGELFNQTQGVRLTHIPYKGSSQALTDLLAGRVSLLFSPASTVMAHVKAGTLKAFGLIGRQRLAALPDVPSFAEVGIADFESALWFGLNAPAGTPADIVERLGKDLATVLARPDVRAQLTAQSFNTLPGGVAPFADLLSKETGKWSRIVKAANIKPD
ncbi:tripartite tricarboxylate transporter substrate binding protein [Limnohabitans sp. Rim8]|uniref:tripartite tricarboxylate transporter substrate binding protein n=1 Tax=Limnohabitans sp. Rim8 TaxID=1100718 RepID=UPI0033057252